MVIEHSTEVAMSNLPGCLAVVAGAVPLNVRRRVFGPMCVPRAGAGGWRQRKRGIGALISLPDHRYKLACLASAALVSDSP
jgi:hypothetical protein